MKTKDMTPVDLNISGETVSFIILKAREFDAKVAPVDTRPDTTHPDEGGWDVLEDFADDATVSELTEVINGLNEDAVVDLIAMAWIGRGDFDASELEAARALADERHRRRSARYLLGIPNLGDVLEDGLEALGGSFDQSVASHL